MRNTYTFRKCMELNILYHQVRALHRTNGIDHFLKCMPL